MLECPGTVAEAVAAGAEGGAEGAVELVRAIADPRKAAEELLEHAYRNYSTDNVTVLVVRFRDPPESVRAD